MYDVPQQWFALHGIACVEAADFAGVERLALALGAQILSTFEEAPVAAEGIAALGRCELVEEVIVGEEVLTRFSGLRDARACTVVLRGAS